MAENFILRVQSSEGTKRIEVSQRDTYRILYEKVARIFSLSPVESFTLYRQPFKRSLIQRSEETLNFEHGSLIYLVPESKNQSSANEDDASWIIPPSNVNANNACSEPNLAIKLIGTFEDDDVDFLLEKMDGRIPRQADPKLCHHNRHSKCLNCIAIEPYDEEYLKNHNPPIKHLSFHSYIRKLQSETPGDRNTFSNLENISCLIKDQCSSGHAPWPKGICTKCQPHPMTLMRQTYRHVDNIMFENGKIVDRFLNYWRSFGHQRIGFLYGRYEAYDGVPLGIRAVVTAIYEPPQETWRDKVQLIFPDQHEATVEALAHRLGIRRIGWIFTDLIPDNNRTGPGPVLQHRGSTDTLFLTAQECIMAGWFQNKYQNKCKYSPDGYFGSKFVTVAVTGDVHGQIQFEGYQVSNQCMALVKADILFPTYDAPELGYIRKTSPEKYVPDVYFKEKDAYNNEVMQIGRPLPLEYLIIDIPTGFPSENSCIKSQFNDTCPIIQIPFGIENRTQTSELQDMDTFALYLQQFSEIKITNSRSKPYDAIDIVADFHLLIFLLVNDVFQISLNQLNPLLDAIRTNEHLGVYAWMNGEEWQTLMNLLQIKLPNFLELHIPTNESETVERPSQLECSRCTFLNNSSNQKCEMCSLELGTTT